MHRIDGTPQVPIVVVREHVTQKALDPARVSFLGVPKNDIRKSGIGRVGVGCEWAGVFAWLVAKHFPERGAVLGKAFFVQHACQTGEL